MNCRQFRFHPPPPEGRKLGKEKEKGNNRERGMNVYICMYVNENGGEMHDRARDKIVCKLRQVSG